MDRAFATNHLWHVFPQPEAVPGLLGTSKEALDSEENERRS